MNRRFAACLRLLALVCLLAILPACSSGQWVEWNDFAASTDAPTFAINEPATASPGPDGLQLVIPVQVDNPNPHAVPLTRATYTVQLAGQTFQGDIAPNVTASPAGRSVMLYLPAVFPANTEFTGLQPDVDATIEYRPPGVIRKLLTDYQIPLPTTSFSASTDLNTADTISLATIDQPVVEPDDAPTTQPAEPVSEGEPADDETPRLPSDLRPLPDQPLDEDGTPPIPTAPIRSGDPDRDYSGSRGLNR